MAGVGKGTTYTSDGGGTWGGSGGKYGWETLPNWVQTNNAMVEEYNKKANSIGNKTVKGDGKPDIPAGYATRVIGKLRGSDDGAKGSSGSSADTGSGGGGGSVSSYTPNDSYLQKYLDLLNQAYQGYRNAQDELLKQRLAQADFDAMESRERNNMNAKLAERRVNNIYGSMNNGARNASASRVWANWLNGGSNIERDRLNSRQTHQINYTNALANNDLNYANTMYNLRSSDLNREADLEYRKYLATLG